MSVGRSVPVKDRLVVDLLKLGNNVMGVVKDFVKRYWIVLLVTAGILVLFGLTVFLYQRFSRDNDFRAVDMTPFRPYIAGYTTGVVRSGTTIRIEFTRDVVGPEEVNRELSGGLLSFRPRIRGTLMWVNTRTLEFTPQEPLPWGAHYRATLRLEKLFEDVADEAREFPFWFTVIEQQYRISEVHYYVGGDGSESLRGELFMADPLSLDRLQEQIVALVKGGEALEVKLMETSDPYRVLLAVPLKGLESGDGVMVSVFNTSRQERKHCEREFVVPDRSQFTLLSHRVEDGDRQSVSLYFSQPLHRDRTYFDGLVSLIDESDRSFPLRSAVDGNVLRIEWDGIRVGENMTLMVDGRIRSSKGVELGEDQRIALSLAGALPSVQFLDDAAVMPVTEGGPVHVPIRVQGLRAVDVVIYRIYTDNIPQYFQSGSYRYTYELRRVGDLLVRRTIPLGSAALEGGTSGGGVYQLDLTRLVSVEPGAIYRIGLSIRRELTTQYCEPGSTLQDIVDFGDLDIDPYETYPYGWDFSWNHWDDPTSESYYIGQGVKWRNLLATDIGLVAKRTPSGHIRAWALSLLQSRPVQGVSVKLLDYRLREMGRAMTGTDGRVEFPPQQGFGSRATVGEPFLLVANQGRMYSYLEVTDGAGLSFSTFDVRGEHTGAGLQGFFYADRGVWAPGDSIHTALIIKDVDGVIPASHPITFSFFSPQGDLLSEQVISSGPVHHYRFSVRTSDDAPTGHYRVRARVGNWTQQQMIRVEHVRAPRLRVTLSPSADVYSTGEAISTGLQAQWLHGAVARGLAAEVSYELHMDADPFPEYPGYRFYDANSSFTRTELFLGRQGLDGEGQASFRDVIPHLSPVPGMLRGMLLARVEETGGGVSRAQERFRLSPYSSYVGLRAPESEEYYLPTGRDHRFAILAVRPDGTPNRQAQLQAKVYKLSWSWWWEYDESSASDYVRRRRTELVAMHRGDELSVDEKGQASFSFRVEDKDRGRYLVRVTDSVSGHSASHIIYFGTYWGDEQGVEAKVLALTADAAEYRVGQKAKISIPTPAGGMVLVSVESGTSLLQSEWVEAQDGVTPYTLPLTEAMAPNVYVTATLIQPYGQTANDLPLRQYGTLPLRVTNPRAVLTPQLDVPESVEPGETLRVRVREADGRPMTYTLAIVDEGLLSLTGFATPDPNRVFSAKQALGVNTYDLYDEVIAAYAGSAGPLLSVGGDEGDELYATREALSLSDEAAAEALRGQRFRPFVRFVGPFHLKAGAKGSHELVIENYIGRVRVMAVCSSADPAYGSAEADVAVRSPLMVQLTVPDYLSPYDRLEVPVTLFSGMAKSQGVSVDLRAGEGARIEGTLPLQTTLAAQSDATLWVRLATSVKAGDRVDLKATATGGNASSEHEVRIGVVNPNSTHYRTSSVRVSPGASVSLALPGMSDWEDVSLMLDVSGLPQSGIEGHYAQLSRYGGEAAMELAALGIVSAVYPDLVPGAGEASDQKASVTYAIERLRGCQTQSGGFASVPRMAHPNEWVSSYVGEFLQLAKERGYYVPAQMSSQWARYQSDRARTWKSGYADSPASLQAYRLYTLARAGAAQLPAMNRLREYDSLGGAAAYWLALAYHVSGNASVAQGVIGRADASPSCPWFGLDNERTGLCLRLFYAAQTRNADPKPMLDLARELRENEWMSAWHRGLGHLALHAYATRMELGTAALNAVLTLPDGETQTIRPKGATGFRQQLDPGSAREGQSVRLENKGDKALFLSVSGSGVPQRMVQGSSEHGLRVRYAGLSADHQRAVSPLQVRQGETFFLEVEVENLYASPLSLTLNVPLPAGWVADRIFTDDAEKLEQGEKEVEDTYYYREFAKGRVFTHFNLSAGERKKFRIPVMATYRGEFYWAPLQAYCDQDPAIRGSVGGVTVKVTQ